MTQQPPPVHCHRNGVANEGRKVKSALSSPRLPCDSTTCFSSLQVSRLAWCNSPPDAGAEEGQVRHDFHCVSYFSSSADSWTQGCWLAQGLKAVQRRELPFPASDQERGADLGAALPSGHGAWWGSGSWAQQSRAGNVVVKLSCPWEGLLSCMMKGACLWAGLLQPAGMQLCLCGAGSMWGAGGTLSRGRVEWESNKTGESVS